MLFISEMFTGEPNICLSHFTKPTPSSSSNEQAQQNLVNKLNGVGGSDMPNAGLQRSLPFCNWSPSGCSGGYNLLRRETLPQPWMGKPAAPGSKRSPWCHSRWKGPSPAQLQPFLACPLSLTPGLPSALVTTTTHIPTTATSLCPQSFWHTHQACHSCCQSS